MLGAIDHGAIYLDAPTQIVRNKSTLWLTPESMLDVEASPLLSQLNAQYRMESAEVVAGGTAARTTLPLTAWRVQCAEKLLNAVNTAFNEKDRFIKAMQRSQLNNSIEKIVSILDEVAK